MKLGNEGKAAGYVFEGQRQEDSDINLDDLQLTVRQVKKFKETELIGSKPTLVALKNPNSYLVATQLKELKVIKNGLKLFSGLLPKDLQFLTDIIYIPTLNCYLLASSQVLYRKDIDSKPPYLFLEINCGYTVNGCLFVLQFPPEANHHKR